VYVICRVVASREGGMRQWDAKYAVVGATWSVVGFLKNPKMILCASFALLNMRNLFNINI